MFRQCLDKTICFLFFLSGSFISKSLSNGYRLIKIGLIKNIIYLKNKQKPHTERTESLVVCKNKIQKNKHYFTVYQSALDCTVLKSGSVAAALLQRGCCGPKGAEGTRVAGRGITCCPLFSLFCVFVTLEVQRVS